MIASFKYVANNSPIHRLDPRTKFALLFCCTIAAASLRDLRVLLGLIVAASVYYGLARLPWRATRSAWLFFIFFIVVIVGFNTLLAGTDSTDTSPVLAALPLGIRITWEGIFNALTIMARMILGALMAIPITFTIPPSRFGVAFRGMGLNDRIAFAVDLAIRLVPTYASTFSSTVDAQRARGFEFDDSRGGLIARLRRLAPLAVPVTMEAIVSGEDITNALDMRGFGQRPRTWLHAKPLGMIDRLLIGVGLVIALATLIWRFSGSELWVPPFPF